MKRICIVPARGGSKRLPGKNMREFCGKPLVCHTIDTVLPFFDKVVFSTDDREMLIKIEQLYSKEKNFHPSKRPEQLATDHSKVIDTVLYYFKQYENLIDEIWLALPTCPMRNDVDVQACILALEKNLDVEGVVSITDYDFPPTLGLVQDETGLIKDWQIEQPWQNGDTRTQDQKQVFRPNGALYGMRANVFRRSKNFYKGNIFGYYMPRERSIDIDTELDWKLAELIKNG